MIQHNQNKSIGLRKGPTGDRFTLCMLISTLTFAMNTNAMNFSVSQGPHDGFYGGIQTAAAAVQTGKIGVGVVRLTSLVAPSNLSQSLLGPLGPMMLMGAFLIMLILIALKRKIKTRGETRYHGRGNKRKH